MSCELVGVGKEAITYWGVMSAPALVVNDQFMIAGRVVPTMAELVGLPGAGS